MPAAAPGLVQCCAPDATQVPMRVPDAVQLRVAQAMDDSMSNLAGMPCKQLLMVCLLLKDLQCWAIQWFVNYCLMMVQQHQLVQQQVLVMVGYHPPPPLTEQMVMVGFLVGFSVFRNSQVVSVRIK